MTKKIIIIEIDETTSKLNFNFKNINLIERAGIINILQMNLNNDYTNMISNNNKTPCMSHK